MVPQSRVDGASTSSSSVWFCFCCRHYLLLFAFHTFLNTIRLLSPPALITVFYSLYFLMAAAAAAATATASMNLPSGMSPSAFMSSTTDFLSSSGNKIAELFFHRQLPRSVRLRRSSTSTCCSYGDRAEDSSAVATSLSPNGSAISVSILFLAASNFGVCIHNSFSVTTY